GTPDGGGRGRRPGPDARVDPRGGFRPTAPRGEVLGSSAMAKKKRPTPSRSRTPVKTRPIKPTRTRVAASSADPPEPETTALAVRTVTPERTFATRVKPAPAPTPLPTGRRAIFVDVENSSRADHIGRVLDHLAIDRADRRVDLIAVGNWRVIGADSARLLARRGAQLVHSAPSTG